MLELNQVEPVKNTIGSLKEQLTLFENRVKETPDIEPRNNSPEEERTRILKMIQGYRVGLDKVLGQMDIISPSKGGSNPGLTEILNCLQFVDHLFNEMKISIEEMVEEQYECKLGIFKQEIFKSIGLIIDPIDFLIPNIRYEIDYLEKFYRIPTNVSRSIMPELKELVEDLENHKITLNQFFKGYGEGENHVRGYNELRILDGVFSRYQFYEKPGEAYKDINICYYEICKAMESFLKEKRQDAELGKFYYQVKDRTRSVNRMSDIFEIGSFISLLAKKAARKYSYATEVKKMKNYADKFHELQKELISYNHGEIEKAEKVLAARLGVEEKSRLQTVMKETRRLIDEKVLPFSRLEMIFSKLFKKDFNIIVQEKEADDLTITITPHHEKKYGRDILERINVIIQEVDFWYPPEGKQRVFSNISKTTQKIQNDEPVDKKEFLKLMQKYDKELEENVRKTYPEKIKEIQGVHSVFHKMFNDKLNREKLERRLANKKIWDEVNSMMNKAGKALSVLSSGDASLTRHVNKFSFIKIAEEETCQLLYDLSMQLFVLFPGVDGKSISNMTNILFLFNDYHDVGGLWAAFSHYFKKNAMPNISVNETMMIQLAREPSCKVELAKLFTKESS